jgi:hypothetical protein
LFERSSWSLDKSASDLANELERNDLQRPSHEVVFQGRTLQEFKKEKLIESIDVGLPAAPSRFEAYSTFMSNTWTDTVTVLKAAEPVKKKAVGSKKEKKSNQVPEVDEPGAEG